MMNSAPAVVGASDGLAAFRSIIAKRGPALLGRGRRALRFAASHRADLPLLLARPGLALLGDDPLAVLRAGRGHAEPVAVLDRDLLAPYKFLRDDRQRFDAKSAYATLEKMLKNPSGSIRSRRR